MDNKITILAYTQIPDQPSNTCRGCKYFSTINQWSSDGFDRMEDWYCQKSNRIIKGAVEWHEEKYIKIPDWCPISTSAIRDGKIEKLLS